MNELKHDQTRYYLHIGIENLSGGERESLDHHLSECGDCKRYAAELGTLESTLSQAMHAQWDLIAPPSLAEDRIQKRIRRRITQKRTLNLVNSLATGATIVGAVIVIAWFFRFSQPVAVTPGSGVVPTRVNQTFGNTLTLLGFGLSGDQIMAGNTLTVTLYWQARVATQTSYAVFIHVQDASGRMLVQSDSVPVNGTRPTTDWKPDEVIEDQRALRLPGTIPPGRYSLIVGVYDPKAGTRLTTGEGKDALTLASVTVNSPVGAETVNSPMGAKSYPIILTGKSIDLTTLQASQPQGQARIDFRLNEEGTNIFSNYTDKHIGQYVAITLDQKVLTCPKIMQPIRTGAGTIQGQFTLEQARQIVDEIKANPERLEFVDAGDAPLAVGTIIQTEATTSAPAGPTATPGANTSNPGAGTPGAEAGQSPLLVTLPMLLIILAQTAFWILLIAGGVWLVLWIARRIGVVGLARENPLDILKARYARGELSAEQYDEMKRGLADG